jgi:hypothetical protein
MFAQRLTSDVDLLSLPKMVDVVETVIAAAPDVLWLACDDTS